MTYFRTVALSAIMLTAATASYPVQASTFAYPATNLNLRSGPSTHFPAIAVMRRGSRITVHGCIENHMWCDVSAGRYRGWASAAYLDMEYRGRYYRIPVYLSHAPVPVVQFEIRTYWENYYTGFSFFDDRQQWYQYDWHDDGPPPGWGEWADDGVDDVILDGLYGDEGGETYIEDGPLDEVPE